MPKTTNRGKGPVATLSIMVCRKHQCHAIMISRNNGGLRLTPSKCCGSWDTVQEWGFNISRLRGLVADIEATIRAMESEAANDSDTALGEKG